MPPERNREQDFDGHERVGAARRLKPTKWAADLVRGFAREFGAAQARSDFVIRVKVEGFPSGAEMLRRPRREWPELIVAVAARLDELRSKAQRIRLDDDDLNMKSLRKLDAIKLLADRLLKPRPPIPTAIPK